MKKKGLARGLVHLRHERVLRREATAPKRAAGPASGRRRRARIGCARTIFGFPLPRASRPAKDSRVPQPTAVRQQNLPPATRILLQNLPAAPRIPDASTGGAAAAPMRNSTPTPPTPPPPRQQLPVLRSRGSRSHGGGGGPRRGHGGARPLPEAPPRGPLPVRTSPPSSPSRSPRPLKPTLALPPWCPREINTFR
ncbi:hypothetical protein SETIT_4G227900v2 [Setaria italica]|uniref:Uncharacterized protein n=2 Tax=Setaria italica TaxID=4555 RepID=A0A368QZ18_SETIT|nr:hypothetical protein SETIT_4G227900v2 [Setaria italica]RCV22531.1 hypothetical protein SETIT_4G227900v2 [Setaria italica]